MKRIVWALILFLSASAFVFAQEDPPLFPEGIAGEGAAEKESLLQQLGLTGSLRGGFWTSSRTLDDKKGIPTGSVWGKAAPRLGENASLHFDGWLGRLSTEPEIGGHLREGYLQLRTGPVDLRVGQQIIVWGRA
ncbi:MAG TPA: hypothetical protein VFA47_01345, partial [Candidatus Manganitrophaceae bacterium]|nr:hypothetical protein [Candidatus Manganitrophaceae bacterium]